MKREGYEHAKFKLVSRDLDMGLACVRGIVDSIWHETAMHFPAGDIGRYSNEEIAIAIDYRGDADELIQVLIKRRLLDEMPEDQGRLYVHDWHDHCDEYTRQKLRNRKMTFANGAPPYAPKEAASTEVNRKKQKTTEKHRDEQKVTAPDQDQDQDQDLSPPNPPQDTQRAAAPEVMASLSEGVKEPDSASGAIPVPPKFQTRQEEQAAEWTEQFGFNPMPDIQDHFGQPVGRSHFEPIFERLEYFQALGQSITAAEFHHAAIQVRDACRERSGKLPFTHKPLCDELANVVANRGAAPTPAVNYDEPLHWRNPLPSGAISSLQYSVQIFSLEGKAQELADYEALARRKMREWKCTDEFIEKEVQTARHLAWKEAERANLTHVLAAMPQYREQQAPHC